MTRPHLHDTDSVTVSRVSGDLYVCEDADDLQVCLISTEGEAAAFLQLPGPDHVNSELTGPVFDPTGHRFYVASQRASGGGVIFEISGPFRRTRPEPFPDESGPKVRVTVLGKPSLRGLIRSGQSFRVSVSDESPPVELDIRLVTRLKREPARARGRSRSRASRPGSEGLRPGGSRSGPDVASGHA